MPAITDTHFTKLINDIMLAGSQQEVRLSIDAAISALNKYKADDNIETYFIDKITDELEKFDPLNETAQQWSNIKMVMIDLRQFKHKSKVA